MQKGGDAAELEAKKKDLEAKRAAAANRGLKTFYKVTVEVHNKSQCYRVSHSACAFWMQSSCKSNSK